MVIHYEPLETFASQILLALQVPEPKARLVAHSLLAASLRGVDSHGVQLLPFYAAQIEHRNIDINVDGIIASESGACLNYDGQNGIGQWVSQVCCNHAIRLGKEHGVSFVISRESNHFGAAAFWAQRMSDAGFLGIVMCNASPLVAPWQGKQPRLGTNPISVSVPGPKTWLLDMATTAVAAGRIFKARINNLAEIPAGWAMDSEGVPTTSTDAALSGLLMPLGGYKGSGLAMMIEVLAGVLGGGAMTTELGGIRYTDKPMRASQCFIAIDIGRFMPLERFAERMQMLAATIKSSAPAKGYDEVLLAGEPEWRAEALRRKQGVPVTDGTWRDLVKIAERYGIAVPPAT
jgi:LDH2 family malate/lactate/ureidoglycolate dehydrogenase